MGGFAPLILQARVARRVLALDLPGFGGSVSFGGSYSVPAYIETLYEVVRALDLPRVHLVCHSLGGQTCLGFALDYPQYVRSLTLIDVAGTYDPRAFLEHVSRGLLGRVRPEKDALISLTTRGGGDIIARLFGYDPMVLAALSSFSENYGARVRQVSRPTLIIWGENDPLLSVENAFSLKENIAGSELHVVPGGDHSPHFDQPELILGWILDFQRRVVAQQEAQL